jgi:isoprenylcysteine carboxyl methyltransferase (ICMT) family protein YpbQ
MAALRRRALLGGVAYGDSTHLVAVWEVAWLARVQRQRRCARSLWWRQGAEGPWVLEVFEFRAWCSSDLGDGWTEALLS